MAKVTKADLSEIKQDTLNLNKHAERGSALTRKSIERFGARLAGVLDRENRIIDGNDRQIAFGEADLNEIEIIEADPSKPVYLRFNDLDLADPENPARELQVALHRSAIESFSVDAENLLAAMAEGLDTSDWFRQDEIDDLLAGLVAPEPVEDSPPDVSKADELQKKWNTSLGQLWSLGKHRLICGDCTDKVTVERLMSGEKAVCMWTDPPYGVSYVGKTKDALTIENDGAGNLPQFLSDAFGVADEILAEGAPIYVAHPAGALQMVFNKCFVDAGWKFHETLVWVKNSMVLGHSDYHYKHEPIMYGWKGKNRNWYAGRDQVSVFEIDRPQRSEEHPTMKPPALVEAQLRNSTKRNDIVYEPFNGSGTTLIVCEQLGLQCRASELSPNFVAVALQRFFDATGIEPVLINEG